MQAVPRPPPPAQVPSGGHRYLSPRSATPEWTPVPTPEDITLPQPAGSHPSCSPPRTVLLIWLVSLSLLATTPGPTLALP